MTQCINCGNDRETHGYTRHGSSMCKDCWNYWAQENPGVLGKVAGPELKQVEEGIDAVTTAMAAKSGFKFGCDPEAFILNPEGKYVSAEGLIPGTKAEPFPVEYGAVQVDGMAAEFNIDPADNFEHFNRNINAVVKQLAGMLPPGHTLDFRPSVVFDEDIYEAAPETAKELGCSPDFNAWTGAVNPIPNSSDNPRLRTASGHIHIGWTEGADLSDPQHVMTCNDFVKQLDWYLGGWSVRIDKDPVRRQLYGRAGACRYKPYGVEYRVLSNFWLTSRDRRVAVWNRLQQAINDMRRVYIPDHVNSSYTNELISSINETRKSPILEGRYRFPLATTDHSYSNI